MSVNSGAAVAVGAPVRTKATARRSAATTFMARSRADRTRELLAAPLAGGFSEPIIVIFSPRRRTSGMTGQFVAIVPLASAEGNPS